MVLEGKGMSVPTTSLNETDPERILQQEGGRSAGSLRRKWKGGVLFWGKPGEGLLESSLGTPTCASGLTDIKIREFYDTGASFHPRPQESRHIQRLCF